MKKETDIEMILSGITIHPSETAKRTAYKRMMSRRAELLSVKSGNRRRTLSEDDLEGIAAAGLRPDEFIEIESDYREEDKS